LSSSRKPQNVTEYLKWLKERHNILLDKRIENYYKKVTTYIKNELKQTDLWKTLIDNLKEYNDEYRLINKGYILLLESPESVELMIKPFDSLVDKSYRKNILNNKNFENPPARGWILPDNWLSEVNDIIRTTIVVKYLDAVEFIIEKLKHYFKIECGKRCRSYFEAREEGYYAAHLYFKHDIEIPSIDLGTESIEIPIEIQITTQLQELIRTLLHKYYGEKRLKTQKKKGNGNGIIKVMNLLQII